jgi:hypothetical protein
VYSIYSFSMTLHLLQSTPILTIYYDSCNDWLFADWQGELTLTAVQEACLELGKCLLQRPYARVLNSNTQVTTAQWEVASWLANEFFPYLGLAGVERLAWVCAPNLRGRNIAQAISNRLPVLQLVLFDELDEAVSWLQRHSQEHRMSRSQPSRPYTNQLQLTRAVQKLANVLQFKQTALHPA